MIFSDKIPVFYLFNKQMKIAIGMLVLYKKKSKSYCPSESYGVEAIEIFFFISSI